MEKALGVMDVTDRQIAENFAAFEADQNPAPIYDALDLIEAAERDLQIGDTAARQQAIARRLRFFAALDQAIDPAWDPERLPIRGVAPPSTTGIVYSSGEVDPATIPDPTVRAEYERALKASKDYERWYDVQFQLRQIDERAMRFVELFLAERYTRSGEDRQEFEALLAASPVSLLRQERLRAIAP
ncbi:hypothetical protein NIES30_13760 [Phormidium tenue NIES-30]|uniref:Uncharacterized protein n=3 Tax=Phormidium tenue TaxID=126344 RepID=A0A1U7J4X0_9CYAN|nr:hypothetical protein NIES30_13760 [Phormidium tenue NIES-30]